MTDIETLEQESRQMRARMDRLERERDLLLAAATKALNDCCDLIGTDAGNALESAIASVKGNAP